MIDKLYYTEEAPNIDEVVRRANAEIQMENRNLQVINLQLHEKHHTSSLKVIDFCFIYIKFSNFYFINCVLTQPLIIINFDSIEEAYCFFYYIDVLIRRCHGCKIL